MSLMSSNKSETRLAFENGAAGDIIHCSFGIESVRYNSANYKSVFQIGFLISQKSQVLLLLVAIFLQPVPWFPWLIIQSIKNVSVG